MDKVIVELDNETAEQFKLFCQFNNPISTLLSVGVFHTKSASITEHFDQNGVMQKVVRYADRQSEVLYDLSDLSPS